MFARRRSAPSRASLALLVCLCFARAVQAQAGVYDDFDGPPGDPTLIDPTLWEVDDDDCRGITAPFAQANGLLLVRTHAVRRTNDLGSEFHFRGDFEFALAYRNLASTVVPSGLPESEPGLSLEVWDSEVLPRDDFYVEIARRQTAAGHRFVCEQWDVDPHGRTRLLAFASRPAASGGNGQLRLARTRGTLVASYEENGIWTRLATYPNHMGPVVDVLIRANTGTNGSFQVDVERITCAPRTMIKQSPRRYGDSCRHLQASTTYLPLVGSTSFGVFTGCAPPNAPLALLVGTQAAATSLEPLAPGCFLHVSGIVTTMSHEFADSTGEGGYLMLVPNDRSLTGTQLFAQMAAYDSSSTAALPVGFSNGIAFVIL